MNTIRVKSEPRLFGLLSRIDEGDMLSQKVGHLSSQYSATFQKTEIVNVIFVL